MIMRTTVLGYPRIGPRRELKRAVEAYWSGRSDSTALRDAAGQLRRRQLRDLRDAGLSSVPIGTFSLYDHVLDTAMLVDAVPARFRAIEDDLDRSFAMARGTAGAGATAIQPLEMTKWFDTNYHYLVPELAPATEFRLATGPFGSGRLVDEYREAVELDVPDPRPVLVGPVTFLLLSKGSEDAPASFRPLSLLDRLLPVYAETLRALADAGAGWVQLDEPALARDLSGAELEAVARAYEFLAGNGNRPAYDRPRILVTCSYGSMGEALPTLVRTPVEGIGLDLVSGETVERIASIGLAPKVFHAGLIDGRNVWRTDLRAAAATAVSLLGSVGELVVGTSCSLLHVPYDLEAEPGLDPALRARLAFARQKVAEVVRLGALLGSDDAGVRLDPTDADVAPSVAATHLDPQVRARLAAIGDGTPRSAFAHRVSAQQAGLPVLPTTTIGSFPQTREIRAARADVAAGRIDRQAYERLMEKEIDRALALQEDIGLDVLVHGEPERNDMVQYFAELLDGYASTVNGWVQSYGSRCVRPPILYGDVSRPEPMTLRWTTYAQSRTSKPVKGILTGPVTMLAWSFVRDDQPLADTARQVALALRDEIRDLEAAGIRYIQVDEPAIRELLPLRRNEQNAYLAWATAAFRLATSGVADSTQIHTHMCYSEFGEIVDAIGDLDADVTSVEAARSHMEIVGDLRRVGYDRGIGPGVYDIHSPRVPEVDEIEKAIRLALEAVPPALLWVNPDCGLKTRGYAEVIPALRNLVQATERVRAELG